MSTNKEIFSALQDLSNPEKAEFLPKFFKTGKGEYAEGDLFIGVTVPDSRKIAKHFTSKINFEELRGLISSEFHEMRLVALLILVEKFEKAKNDLEAQKKIVDFYLAQTQYINNWDLVDLSCYKILGRYCFENNQSDILIKLSKSNNLWEKRIAIVSTMYYVKKQNYGLTKELVVRNLNHTHDLIHKANGWLLREMGKKNEDELLNFLKNHYQQMPRTTLRYAIEKLDEDLRQDFLKGRI